MTNESRGDFKPGPVSSPPCSMHEVDPVYMGLVPAPDLQAGPPSNAELGHLGKALLFDIPDAVVFADCDGLIRFWNGGAVRIFGFTQPEAVGQSLDIIIPERLRQRHWDGYHHMMASGQSQHAADELLAVPAISKSGDSLSIQFTVAPVKCAEGVLIGIVAVMRDNTATFNELRRLRAGK